MIKLIADVNIFLFLLSFSCMTAKKPQPAAVSPDVFTAAKPDTATKAPVAGQSPDKPDKPPLQVVPAATNININIHVSEQDHAARPTSPDSLFASIERTPCYGRCPSYKISVYKSGYVIYDGKRFVDKIGKYTTRLTGAEMQSLANKARQINYMNLDDVYDSQVTDLPSTITSMNLDGKKKIIKARFNVPVQLREFERFFDELFSEKSWIPTSIE